MNWNMNIRKVNGGYILEPNDENPIVVEEKEYDNEARVDQEAIRNVFYHMMTHFAVNNDKHAYEGEGQFITIEVSKE